MCYELRWASKLSGFLALVVLLCGSAGDVTAETTLYFDEAEYLAVLSSQGLVPLIESFEDDDYWGLVRSTIVGGTFSAPDVPSQGITWTGSGGGIHGVTTSEGAARTGDWGFYSSPHHNILSGITDGFTVTAPQPIYGFAGHLRGSFGADVILILDGNEASPVDLGEICTPDPNGGDETCIDRNLGNTPFVGLIDTNGFSQVEVRETEAHDDEAILLFSDDFTLGFAALPAPGTNGVAWINGAGGVFSTGSNWDGGSPSSASQNAIFNLASTAPYTVTFDGIANNKQAVIATDQVAFDFAGSLYALTETNLTRESLIVGEIAGDNASLSLTNGNLVAENAVVAHASGTTGSLTVDAGALMAVNNQLRIGSGGAGSMTVQHGGIVTSGTSVIGRFSGAGTVVVHGSASSFSSTSLVVGKDGAGTINVDDDATLLSTRADVAVSADGSVNLTGAETIWRNIGTELSIGSGDQSGSFYTSGAPGPYLGTIHVENGAQLESSTTYLGRTRTGRGELNVVGPGSSWVVPSGNTYIGFEGDGEVNILQGATAQTGQSFVGRFGIRDQLQGLVNVDGAGSNWTSTSTIYVGFNNDPQFYSGAGLFFAEGNLHVTHGGTVAANQLVLAGRKISKGVVNINGADSVVTANSVALGRIGTGTFTFGSNAEMTVADGGLLAVSGNIDVYHGLLTLDDGTINANTLRLRGQQLVDPGDPFETGDTRVTLAGNGQINASVKNDGGFVEPGLSVGVLHVRGDYAQAGDGTLTIELGGTDNSDPLNLEYDQLLIDGLAILNGTLDVKLIDLGGGQFVPQLDDSFGILSATGGFGGMFDTTNLPPLAGGLGWQLNPGDQTLFLNVVSAETADFDSDGDVDNADLTHWESSFGVNPDADADADGDSDGADFLAWQRQFTRPGSQQTVAAIPEPAGMAMVMLGSLLTAVTASFRPR